MPVWYWLLRRSIVKRSIDMFLALSAFVSMEKIYQTLQMVYDHIFKHFKAHQKYSVPCRIFNSLAGVGHVMKHSVLCLIYNVKQYEKVSSIVPNFIFWQLLVHRNVISAQEIIQPVVLRGKCSAPATEILLGQPTVLPLWGNICAITKE